MRAELCVYFCFFFLINFAGQEITYRKIILREGTLGNDIASSMRTKLEFTKLSRGLFTKVVGDFCLGGDKSFM